MAVNRRGAKFESVLVYMDEPQLITMTSYKSRLVAVAVPSDVGSMFFATTVSKRDWANYLRGTVDLRYLFTFPELRVNYTFNLEDLRDNKLMMTPFDGVVPEKYLPSPRFFSSNHTEEFGEASFGEDQETLLLDGEWELQDFGQFQQKYSDIYAFYSAVERFKDPNAAVESKQNIKLAFLGRPFRGGFSYVHLFRELNDNVPVQDRIHLDKIQYASPGFVDMFGNEQAFASVNGAIVHFLSNRGNISKAYSDFYRYLSERKYLQMSGENYVSVPAVDAFINQSSKALAEMLLVPEYATIKALSADNPLVTAKVILSFYRRLSEAAAYFAQGRVTFPV